MWNGNLHLKHAMSSGIVSVILASLTERLACSVPVALLLTGWHVIRERYGIEASELSASHDAIFVNNEHWRVVTSAITHSSYTHLLLNIVALFSFQVERTFSPFVLARLLTLSHHAVVYIAYIWPFAPSVGFSGVLFAVYAARTPLRLLDPIVAVLVVALFIPQSSFVLHVAGVILGFMSTLGRVPLDAVITPYMYANLLLWIGIVFVTSLVDTRPDFAREWLRVEKSILNAEVDERTALLTNTV